MKKGNILVIHRALAPYRIDFFNRLSERWACDIYFEYNRPIEQSFSRDTLEGRIRFDYHTLPPARYHRLPNWRQGLADILRQKDYDLVFCSEFNLLTLELLYYRKRYGLRFKLLVMCDDNADRAEYQIRQPRYNLKNLLLSRVDYTLLCSTMAREIYTQRYGTPERWLYMPILQDDQVLRHSAERGLSADPDLRNRWLQSTGAQHLLLYVGRLSPEKNLVMLLEQWHCFVYNHPHESAGWHLLLVGDGDELDRLKQCTTDLQLQAHTSFVGKCEGDLLNAYYAIADALILPSSRELFGSVIGESLAIGTPTACSTIAGAVELVQEGENGVRFAPTPEGVLQGIRSITTLPSQGIPPKKPSLLPFSFDHYISDLEASIERIIQSVQKK